MNSDELASQNATDQEATTSAVVEDWTFDSVDVPIEEGFDSLDAVGAGGSGGGGTNRKVRIADDNIPVSAQDIARAYTTTPNMSLGSDSATLKALQGKPLFAYEIVAQYLRNPKTYGDVKYWKIGYVTGRSKDGRVEVLVREFSMDSFQPSTAPKSSMYRVYLTGATFARYFRAIRAFAGLAQEAYDVNLREMILPSSGEVFQSWITSANEVDQMYVSR